MSRRLAFMFALALSACDDGGQDALVLPGVDGAAADAAPRDREPIPDGEVDATADRGPTDARVQDAEPGDAAQRDAAPRDAEPDQPLVAAPDGAAPPDAAPDAGPDAPPDAETDAAPSAPYPGPCVATWRDLNGAVTARHLYTYDAEGRVVEFENGDSRVTYRYSADGRSRTTEFFSRGMRVQRAEERLDAEGRVVRSEADNGPDGTVDSVTLYRYGPHGLEELTVDHGGDGVNFRSTYRYDAQGRLASIATDQDADGRIDHRTTYQYAADGRSADYEVDSDADGRANARGHQAYDENGRLVRSTLDIDADGDVDRFENWHYDADGRIERVELDTDGDGRVDSTLTYDYACHDG